MVNRSRGKGSGQVKRLIEELSNNHRLYWVFSICHELKIDDPIAWMNNVPPVLVDWWISFFVRKQQIENEAYQKATGKGQQRSPDELSELLEGMSNGGTGRSRGSVLQGRPRP